MNLLFELFRGGIVFEVSNLKHAEIAEKSGAVALLLDMASSPLHPDGTAKELEEILGHVRIPVLCSFRPGHFVEAEVLSEMGVWGVYADSRFEELSSKTDLSSLKNLNFPLLADINIQDDDFSSMTSFIPVIRGESIEEIINTLEKKQEKDFLFVTGPIETVSDIALLKRMGADTIIAPLSVFEFEDSESYLHKLVQASFYYNNTKKLAGILEG